MKPTKSELLDKILHHEAEESRHGMVASNLCRDYTEMNRIFKDGDIVQFKKKYMDKVYTGKVRAACFLTSPVGIRYTLNVLNKDASQSKADPGFYYVYEKELLKLN